MYFKYDSTIDSIKIRRALVTIQTLSCLQFVPYGGEHNYIIFRSCSTDGCSSQVGRNVNTGAQYINLGPGCLGQKTILHEVYHSLGMWHEQSRPDRDEYVQILETNVRDDKKYNFLKRKLMCFRSILREQCMIIPQQCIMGLTHSLRLKDRPLSKSLIKKNMKSKGVLYLVKLPL